MYEEHFGLSRRPFDGGIAQEANVYLGPRQQAVIDNLRVALTTLDSAVALTGPPGVGKTTMACSAVRTLSPRFALGWIGSTPLNVQELLELLHAEFGFAAARMGRIERLQMWRQFLNEMNATASRVFVMVEHAEDMGLDVLRTLESLTAADPNGCPGANIVLMGQPELTDLLAAPTLRPLQQRLRLKQRVESLSAQETSEYLAHRISAAGGESTELVAPAAIALLHDYAGGVPRVLDNLCETALTVAASHGEKQLSPERVTHVAVELFGMEAAIPATASQPGTTSLSSARSADAPATAAGSPPAPSARDSDPLQSAPDSAPAAQTATEPKSAAFEHATPHATSDDAVDHDGRARHEPDTARSARSRPEGELEGEPEGELTEPSAEAGRHAVVTDSLAAVTTAAALPAEPELPVLTDAVEVPANEPAPIERLEFPTPPGPLDFLKKVDLAATAEHTAVDSAPAPVDGSPLEDMSNSMAESLFDDAGFDLLSAALAEESSPKRRNHGPGLSLEEAAAAVSRMAEQSELTEEDELASAAPTRVAGSRS